MTLFLTKESVVKSTAVNTTNPGSLTIPFDFSHSMLLWPRHRVDHLLHPVEAPDDVQVAIDRPIYVNLYYRD